MFDGLLARLRQTSRSGGGRNNVSVLLAFLIMSVGLGALAWRSYNLSVRTERGAKTIAIQYSGYASEITARRVDAAARAEMTRVSDEWQQMERRVGEPTFSALRDWISRHNWVVSAIYVPDYDPASSIYVAEITTSGKKPLRLTREFFTSTGMVRYTFDPRRLLSLPTVQAAIRQQPLSRGRSVVPAIQQHADVTLVQNTVEGLVELEDGFAGVTRLGPPLEEFGVRAFVRTEWVGGSGWQNQRVLSLWVSLLALVLTGVGAVFALRAMKKESETMKLRGDLIANVSHELRTPLSMIRLGAETLMRGKLKPNEQSEIQEQILREVLLLTHLVENVLDVARIQNRSTKALAFTPVHPRDLIRNLLSTYDSWIRSRGFTCRLEIDESIGEQMWDRDAVSRALLNLVDNAIKYSGDDRSMEVVLRQTAEDVIIEVRDHGVGIDADDVARIFDPYYRAQFSDTITRRGAGLGLTLVRQIVESHGGRVEVESVKGEGSTFRLLFPAALSAPAGVPAISGTREAV